MAATDALSETDAAHLLCRAGFGADERSVTRLTGRTRAQGAEQLLSGKPNGARGPGGRKNRRQGLEKLESWWLKRMADSKRAAHEKMALFWHDHFPSSFDVVGDLRELAQQNATFREHGLESFRDLVYQVTRDPAMLDFLDGKRNSVGSPNENYARELAELFTLGAKDENGVDNYSQADVMELARALTGLACRIGKLREALSSRRRRDPIEGVQSEATAKGDP